MNRTNRQIKSPKQIVDNYKNKKRGYPNFNCVMNFLWQSFGKSNQKDKKLAMEYKRQLSRLYRIARRRKEL